MRISIALLTLFLFLLTGCGANPDREDMLPIQVLELTDGFCLVAKGRVILNHHQIEYYDYGAHLIYLKPDFIPLSILENLEGMSVYAGGKEIYTVITFQGSSSTKPVPPVIWTDPIFYTENIWAIDWLQGYEERQADMDPREDPRIEEALRKYGQYRKGMQCEFLSIRYESDQEVVVKLKLTNEDPVNYYYLDPAKMGVAMFHFFTTGLIIWDEERHNTYLNREELSNPDAAVSWDPAWLSLLEHDTSDTLTIVYEHFDPVPYGSYDAFFTFPGLTYQVDWEDLNQDNGRIWLGEILLHKKLEISYWY